MPFQINGVVPIVPTPFTPDDRIDFASLARLIDFAHGAQACAVCLPAYASEFYKLSEEERHSLVAAAVQAARGRIPVVGQVNYASARHAAEWARRNQECGASAISVAVPRMFGLAEADLLRYFDVILKAIDIPLVIQDFNPGGITISPAFIRQLHAAHPHFRYVKLEEPLMAARVEAIRAETAGEVGVLEGWGGMYLLELVPAGIAGVMPGLGLADLLARVFRLLQDGQRETAYDTFQGILPQIVYCLQNMELYHHAEKALLKARGVLDATLVRDSTVCPRPGELDYIAFLNGRVLALLDRLDMPHNPGV